MERRLRARLGDTRLTSTPIEARVERFAAMGTRIELHQFGAGARYALVEARRAIEAVDDALTIHRSSPATALNDRLAASASAPIDDPLLFEALTSIEAAQVMTEGLFDPTVGAGAGQWGAIRIDSGARRIEAARPIAFDFGGFGKGYALDRACAAMRAAGVVSAFLSAGESSIAVIGGHPLGGAWPVAIPHPWSPEEWLVELELEDASLSVSSTTGAGASAPGRSLMVRPTDGTIVAQAATTVAVEPTGALAEMMSTALLVADDETAARMIARRRGHRHRFPFANAPTGPVLSAGSIS